MATTDQAFAGVTSNDWIARRLRLNVVPLVLPLAFRFRTTRRFMFRTVSQTAVNYRGSRLSEGHVGAVHGGDRLPWVASALNGSDNFAPLTSLDWQVHVYGDATREMQAVCNERSLRCTYFPGERSAVAPDFSVMPCIWYDLTATLVSPSRTLALTR